MRTRNVIIFLAAMCLTGCFKEVSQKHFARESEIHDLDRITSAQASAGASHDGMLYAHHFSGSELNSLGRSKLHLMSQSKPATDPLVVYLNTRDDPASQARQGAIARYFAEHGLPAADVQVKAGPNPNAAFLASSGLIRYSKTESGSPEGTVNSTGTNTGSVPNASAPNK
jgi:hypothetical protein